jgi:hypothetical protein
LVVTSGNAIIKRGARIGQYLIMESESNGTYQGSYGDSVKINISEVDNEN